MPKLSNYYNKDYITPIPPTQCRGEGYAVSVTLTYSTLSRMDLLLVHAISFLYRCLHRRFYRVRPFPLYLFLFFSPLSPIGFVEFLIIISLICLSPFSPILSLKVFGFVSMVHITITHSFILYPLGLVFVFLV